MQLCTYYAHYARTLGQRVLAILYDKSEETAVARRRFETGRQYPTLRRSVARAECAGEEAVPGISRRRQQPLSLSSYNLTPK